VQEREQKDMTDAPRNGGPENPLYYETLEDTIVFDTVELKPPDGVSFVMR